MLTVVATSGANLASRRRRWVHRLLIGIPAVMAAVLIGLLVAAQAADDRAGCGSVDPTDPANYSEVSILNDTSMTVRLDACEGGYCRIDRLPALVPPGRRFTDDAACAASGVDMTSWRVSSADGRVLGYIAVDTPRKHDGLVFPVTHASADRKTPTTPV